MYLALIGIAFFLVLLLIAIRLPWSKQEVEAPGEEDLIHRSGIFSIVRKSPRENIGEGKPADEDVAKYLDGLTVDISGKKLTSADRKALLGSWEDGLEASIVAVEDGDKEGVEFYYFDFADADPVCAEFLSRGHFVTREEIHKFPEILPPLHLGCACRISGYHGTSEELRETTLSGMRPFFAGSECPPLPDWRSTVKPSSES